MTDLIARLRDEQATCYALSCDAADALEAAQKQAESWKFLHDALEETRQAEKAQAQAEIERLTALTEADAKEIGSYREGTGLRGGWKQLQAENERLQLELKYKLDQSERIKNLEAEIERLLKVKVAANQLRIRQTRDHIEVQIGDWNKLCEALAATGADDD